MGQGTKVKRDKGREWKVLRQRVIAMYDNCVICGKPVDKSLKFPDRMSPTVDHVIPVSNGGTNDLQNLTLAHYTCNSKRQNRSLDEVRYSPRSRNWLGE